MSSHPSPGLTRRQALRQTFFYSAALALAGRFPTALAQGVTASDLHFLMLGDWGALGATPAQTLEPKASGAPTAAVQPAPAGTVAPPAQPPPRPQQTAVAAGMQAYVREQRIKPEGLFLLGDNFYGAMPGGVHSPRWKVAFEDMYPASFFPGPCWALLGNHDYDEDAGRKLAAEMAYTDVHPGTRWTLPNKWYRVDWPARNPLLTVLVLDSNYKNTLIYLTPEEKARQLQWLATELGKPRVAPWLVCLGHHPIYSNGVHGDNPPLIQDWGALLQKHQVPFYFCGHDHDLQHLELEGLATSFVVSGGGGAALTKLKKTDRGLYSQSVHGFTHLQISPERFIVRHLDPQARQLHAFSKTPDGRVQIL